MRRKAHRCLPQFSAISSSRIRHISLFQSCKHLHCKFANMSPTIGESRPPQASPHIAASFEFFLRTDSGTLKSIGTRRNYDSRPGFRAYSPLYSIKTPRARDVKETDGAALPFHRIIAKTPALRWKRGRCYFVWSGDYFAAASSMSRASRPLAQTSSRETLPASIAFISARWAM